MKFVITTWCLFVFMTLCSHEATEDQHFVVIYTVGENWDINKQPDEQLYFAEHSKHLSQLKKTNKITIGGRYSDKGMILLLAPNKEKAEKMITDDPSVENDIFNVEIYPLYLFYKGCIE